MRSVAKSEGIGGWISDNLREISGRLQTERQRQSDDLMRRQQEDSGNNEHYNFLLGTLDLRKRLLSEMPLCDALKDLSQQPPEGWEIVDGAVLAFNDPVLRRDYIGHRYFANQERQVVADLLIAQFIGPLNEKLKRGERVKLVQDRLPIRGVVTTVDEKLGIAYLTCSKELLADSLGFIYE